MRSRLIQIQATIGVQGRCEVLMTRGVRMRKWRGREGFIELLLVVPGDPPPGRFDFENDWSGG